MTQLLTVAKSLRPLQPLIFRGKKAALLNDTVTCPKHGTNPIVECDTSYEEGGRGIVVHGCKSACGSVVYASLPDVEIG